MGGMDITRKQNSYCYFSFFAPIPLLDKYYSIAFINRFCLINVIDNY